VLASAAAKIAAGTTYNLLLSIDVNTSLSTNGNYAMLTVSTSKTSTTIAYNYPWNVVDGVNLGLNYGIIGTGTNNATATFNNIVSQVPIPATTWTYTTYFASGRLYFDTPTGGTWTANGTGLTVVPPSGGFAIKPIDPGLALTPTMSPGTFRFQNNSNVDIAATIKFLGGRAGLVFDYSPGAFNFAALLGDKNQVALGHYTTAGGFVIDATANILIGNSTVLEIVANGDLVNVLVNGTQMLSMTYGQVTTDNQFGLLSWTGSNTFNALTVTTNDPGLVGAQNMVAAAAPTGPAQGETSLTMPEVDSELGAAIQRLSTTLSLDQKAIAELWATPITIANLPAAGLGATTNGAITLSPNAGGWGWFIDPTPYNDSAFPNVTADGLAAPAGSPASDEMDLLTVEMHELAHVLGYGDTSSGLMSEYLTPGTRLASPVGGTSGEDMGAIALGEAPGQSASGNLGVGGSPSATLQKPSITSTDASAVAREGTPNAWAFGQPTGQIAVASGSLAGVNASTGQGYLSSLTQSDIVVKPTIAGLLLRSGDLIGSFVELNMSLGWSDDIAAEQSGAPSAPIEDPATAQSEWSTAPAPSSHASAKPQIAWDGDQTGAVKSVDREGAGPSQEWLDDFLNNLGQNGSANNPNAGIRIRPNAAGAG
jgi:hypothetical protein